MAKSKWAVFYDDGLHGFFDSKEKAKARAAKLRAADRANGDHNSCFFRKLTKQERRDFGFQTAEEEYAETVRSMVKHLMQFYYGRRYTKKLALELGDYLERVGGNIKCRHERRAKSKRGCRS